MQASSFVLADAQATPVNHTFAPNGRDDKGTFWYVDRGNANAIGYWKVSVEFKEPSSASAGVGSKDRTYRVRVGIHEPVLETLGTNTVSGIPPAPTVAYVVRSFVEFVLPERGSLVDRQTILKMTSNLLVGVAQIRTVVESLDRLY